MIGNALHPFWTDNIFEICFIILDSYLDLKDLAEIHKPKPVCVCQLDRYLVSVFEGAETACTLIEHN